LPTVNGAPALELEGITFGYGHEPVLGGVSFSVASGEFVALAGPNGSGKSTLVRIALGLLPTGNGRARLLGSAPGELRDRWRVGYVPQRRMLTDVLPATVGEVVAAGLLARRGWWRRPGATDRAAVDAALATVDLGGLRHRRLGDLSGGQQQRALIAKALVSEPELLILDEPVAGVDAASQRRFRDVLVATVARGGAVLLVSHELGAVADDLDRIVVLKRGVAVFDGPPAELAATGVSLGIHAHDLPVWLEGPQ
jgi:zinc transport system ATP-binding protein